MRSPCVERRRQMQGGTRLATKNPLLHKDSPQNTANTDTVPHTNAPTTARGRRFGSLPFNQGCRKHTYTRTSNKTPRTQEAVKNDALCRLPTPILQGLGWLPLVRVHNLASWDFWFRLLQRIIIFRGSSSSTELTQNTTHHQRQQPHKRTHTRAFLPGVYDGFFFLSRDGG